MRSDIVTVGVGPRIFISSLITYMNSFIIIMYFNSFILGQLFLATSALHENEMRYICIDCLHQ